MFFGNDWTLLKGSASEDKEYDSPTLYVLEKTLVPFDVGELKNKKNSETFKIEDADSGLSIEGSISTGNSLTCEYLGSTNASIPDIVRGEQVFVLRHSDSDRYFWMPLGRDDRLRARERRVFRISDSNDRNAPLDESNTYEIILDTRDGKSIRIHTAKSSGEDYLYTFEIDAGESVAYMQDDSGNRTMIESKIPRVVSENRDGTMVDLFREDLIMKAPRQIVTETPVHTQRTKSGDGVSVIEGKDFGFKASGTMFIKGTCVGIEGSTVVDGPLLVKGGIVSGSGYSVGSVSPYDGVSTDTDSGSGSNPNNTPRSAGGMNNRHCSAWEQIVQMASYIVKQFEILGGTTYLDEIEASANASKMEKNRGE